MKFPKIHSLPARALSRILTGKHISHRNFQNDVASYRLSAAIFVLRDYGWPVCDIWHEGKTSDPTNRTARFKKYFLPENLITQLGDKGRDYREKVERWERMRTKGAATPKAHNKVKPENHSMEADK